MKNVVIYGLGYVGLTFGVYVASKGFKVHGVDTSQAVLTSLSKKKAHFYEDGFDEKVKSTIESGLFTYGSSYSRVKDDSSLFVVTVGTPLTDGKIRMNSLDNVLKEISLHIKDGDSVVLRSTVEVGCTRSFAKTILDKSKVDYFLGFCPERTLEGVALEELANLPQIVSGIDKKSLEVISNFFLNISNEIVAVESVEEAELTKLLNNSERDLKFALANEIALMCDELKISAHNVIRAANYEYKRSDLKTPGPVGGPCLEKDPYILTTSFLNKSYSPKLFKTGREINESIIEHAVKRIFRLFDNKNINNIAILGIAFKGMPPTGDTRGSLAIDLIKHIKKTNNNYKIIGHDYLATKDDMLSCGVDTIVDDLRIAISESDILFLQNNHPNYKTELKTLLDDVKKDILVYDFWNQIDYIENPKVTYYSLGGGQ